MYEYRATLLRVLDGDSVELRIDLGFQTHREEILRLIGINTPELNAKTLADRERARVAKEYLLSRLPTDRNGILVRTVKDRSDKYGRMLATVLVGDVDINAEMLRFGYAEPYDGGARRT